MSKIRRPLLSHFPNMQNTSSSALIKAGIVAGPLLMGVALIQAFSRDGFDPVRHPMSLLSLGNLGWIQIADFVISGLLLIGASVGLKRSMKGPGSVWAPRMILLYGIALIVGGVFTADAGLGFPPGAPPGAPEKMSAHGMIHAFAPIIGFLAVTVFFGVVGRRHFIAHRPTLAWLTLAIAVVSFVLANLPNVTADWEAGVFNFVPLWIGGTLAFCYVSVLLAVLMKEINR
jgi:hypothetical protein